MGHCSSVRSHVPCVTSHLSTTPTATATAKDPPVLTAPNCTVDWFTKTKKKKQQKIKTLKNVKIFE